MFGIEDQYGKSIIAGINVDEAMVKDLALEFGCEAGEWPLKYLGLPLGRNPLALEFWTPVIEKVSIRLDGWKKGFLSRGGRVTLIQSVLASLPINYMLIFKLPGQVVEILEKMTRAFLWNVQEGERVKSLAAWEIIMKSKRNGGLVWVI